jgi:cytochrome d ubiquinol oxidase subunit I
MSIPEKISRGKEARQALTDYKQARDRGDEELASVLKAKFYDEEFKENYFKYFGYSFYDDPSYFVPNVPITFYSFHIMVILGFYFLAFFVVFLYFTLRNEVAGRKFWLRLALFTIPLPYIASEAGWIVAEVGRQPWTIQDLLPTIAAVSKIDSGSVIVTFWLFAVTFTVLAIAEVRIMLKAIKKGSLKEGGTK